MSNVHETAPQGPAKGKAKAASVLSGSPSKKRKTNTEVREQVYDDSYLDAADGDYMPDSKRISVEHHEHATRQRARLAREPPFPSQPGGPPQWQDLKCPESWEEVLGEVQDAETTARAFNADEWRRRHSVPTQQFADRLLCHHQCAVANVQVLLYPHKEPCDVLVS